MNKKTKAAVVFINGQSNAHAHQQNLEDSERVKTPLKNVFSLDRNPNQSLDIDDVVWSGWTSEGKNLGETQDNTACFAYYLANMWQNAIDTGVDLPDLYIVQISIGSQGIINGKWNRDKEPIVKPGRAGEVDISLLPLALKINKLVMENLRKADKNPEIIGWHWLGCEQEIWHEAYLRDDFSERYDYHFDVMCESMGGNVPTYIYKLYVTKMCERFEIPVCANDYINRELERQVKRIPSARLVCAEESPYWDEKDDCFGLFAPDKAHYTRNVQKWFAEKFFNEVTNCENN